MPKLKLRKEWVPCANGGKGGYGWFDQFDRPYGGRKPGPGFKHPWPAKKS